MMTKHEQGLEEAAQLQYNQNYDLAAVCRGGNELKGLEASTSKILRGWQAGNDGSTAVPLMQILSRRDLAVTGGTYPIETQLHKTVQPALRAFSAAAAAGCTFMSGLSSNLSFIREDNLFPPVAWSLENAPESSLFLETPSFSSQTISPHRACSLILVSMQFLRNCDVGGGAEVLLKNMLTRAISSAIDLAIFGNFITYGPAGLSTLAPPSGGTQDPSKLAAATSGVASYSSLIDAETAVLASNTTNDGTMAWIFSPFDYGNLQKSVVSEGFPRFIIDNRQNDGVPLLNGFPVYVTANCPQGTAWFGRWSDLVVAIFGPGIEIVSDIYTRATTGEVLLTVNCSIDLIFLRAISFAKMTSLS